MSTRITLPLIALAMLASAQNQRGPGRQEALKFDVRVVTDSEFTMAHLIRLSENDERANTGLLSIWFTTSKSAESALLSGVVSMHGRAYSAWKAEHDESASRKWKVARFLAWNGSAILQSRDEQDTICRRILRGPDFMTISQDGVFGSVIDFSLTAAHPLPNLEIMARSNGPLDARAAIKIWERFNSVQAGNMSIDLRSDPWFVNNIHALAFNPFEPNVPAPSEGEARMLQSLYCLSIGHSVPSCICYIGDHPQNNLAACQH